MGCRDSTRRAHPSDPTRQKCHSQLGGWEVDDRPRREQPEHIRTKIKQCAPGNGQASPGAQEEITRLTEATFIRGDFQSSFRDEILMSLITEEKPQFVPR